MTDGRSAFVFRSAGACMRILAPAVLCLGAAACNSGVPEQQPKQEEPEPVTVDIPQIVTEVAPGTTPMAERVAVIGLLNKRNGISRDLTMRPGQAFRVGDVIVRLRACETTAPWEEQKLTGAFIQLDVRNPKDQFQRVFSGWIYKETPSLNVVEHPVYDAWPKSCAMTHPEAGPASVRAGSSSSRSSASKSGRTSSPAPTASPGNDAAPVVSVPLPPAATTAPSGATQTRAEDSNAI